jgi:hypothetical protein
MLHVGDMKGHMAELVRHDAGALKFLRRRLGPLEHLHDGSLRILEGEHVGNRRLGILAAGRPDAVRRGLFFKCVEIVVRPELKPDAHALHLGAPAQHHRVMIDGVGQIRGILLLGREGQAENVGVISDLLVDVGHLVAGMSDLADADHGCGSRSGRRAGSGCSNISRIAATSRSPTTGTARR